MMSTNDRPLGWTIEGLGDLFTLQLGKMLNKTARETMPQFPYLCNKDVQWGRIDFSKLRYMHFDAEEREKFRLLPGDLLICEGGEIGRTALVDQRINCYYQKTLHRLRSKEAGIEPKFVYHFMRFAATTGLLNQFTSQTTIAHLTKEKLARFQVPLPPLAEQCKIAAILSSVDDAIEKAQAVIDQVQVVKRGLMQELFTRSAGTRSPWIALADIVDLRLSGVDKLTTRGERRVRLCNYSDVYANRAIVADMDFMVATANETEIRNYQLQAGDVVITKDSETPDDIGVPAVVREQIADLICGYHLAILRPVKAVLDGEYLHYALCTDSAKRQFQIYANGITRFGLRAGDIKRVKIYLPPLSQQRKIAVVLSAIDDFIKRKKATIRQIQIVKRALMPILLTGELRVALDSEAI